MSGVPNIIQVIDLFSGCGGMSWGFVQSSSTTVQFRVLGGLDIDKHAAATYEKMIGRPCLLEDVRNLREPEGLQRALRAWGYDSSLPLILIGCAPCQGFSSHRKKDARSDQRNELLSAFADVALKLSPDLVIMENVPEIFYRGHWHHYADFRAQLEGAGFKVRARVENLASFGVPQERYRALVLGSRDPAKTAMPVPTRTPATFATVRSAIGHLPPLKAGEKSSTDPMHETSRHRPETVKLLSLIPKDGGSRRALPADVGPACHKRVDGFRDVYGRLWWDRPAVAITARCRTPSCGRFTHPEQDRGLSVREAALLQGFPADFVFSGPFDDKYKQIGNAVAPMFSAALSAHIASVWCGSAQNASETEDVIEPIAKSISSALAAMKRKLRTLETAQLGRAA